MPKLTKDIMRTYELGDINEFPILGGQTIYQGAAIGLEITCGYARILKAGDRFLGFAEDHIDAVNLSDGQKNIRVRKRGSVVLEISDVTITDVGKAVYAADDNTFTMSSSNTVYIGRISRLEFGENAVVDFDASITI